MSDPDGLYVGLISGTSADAIDAALVDIRAGHCRLLADHTAPMDDTLHDAVLALCRPGDNEIERMAALDMHLGTAFADAALAVIARAGLTPRDITAIGSHGQTIRHLPALHTTVQIGNADVIAQRTGITTISDFRRRDMVLGGQGAPLVPRFHQTALACAGRRRAVLNLGGIANLTLLDGDTLISGFDTGPANVLMDYWCRKHTGARYDADGHWARGGTALPALLARFLEEPYFALPIPKSTGRERFNGAWLEARLDGDESPQAVQATLLALTAQTVADCLRDFAPDDLLACGGGASNSALLEALAGLLPGVNVDTTSAHGAPADMVEASAFAWLAWAHLAGVEGNAPQVTGALSGAILGARHPA
ncbi:anhydro-N-acetylmuramic acid kinase [Isoalcanivorax indicus]|uniref:anhydro-N-acetylmuramic acid kinase n=1 Tax=Isoalcanivorax indicus TaxID=2202653 RepID=UPI000DB99270|nr:anhydro-N-acetylmuramic acid kinase [Isoalcanivorax indicus]